MQVLLALPFRVGHTTGKTSKVRPLRGALFRLILPLHRRQAASCSELSQTNTLLKLKLLHLGCSWELGRGSCLMR